MPSSKYAKKQLLKGGSHLDIDDMKQHVSLVYDMVYVVEKYPELTDYYINRLKTTGELGYWLNHHPYDENKIMEYYFKNKDRIHTVSYPQYDREYEEWNFEVFTRESLAKLFIKRIEKEHQKFLKNIETMLDNQ